MLVKIEIREKRNTEPVVQKLFCQRQKKRKEKPNTESVSAEAVLPVTERREKHNTEPVMQKSCCQWFWQIKTRERHDTESVSVELEAVLPVILIEFRKKTAVQYWSSNAGVLPVIE